jgi:hypothetical protein
MWAPIIAWCALETLAESMDALNPEQIALEAFDRLRLRQPLGEAFKALGFEGEAGWRAAARIKVVLLAQAEIAKATMREKAKLPSSPAETDSKPIAEPESVPDAQSAATSPDSENAEPIVCGIPRELWSDPDVRWLTGVHDAGASTYVVCEPYEELLWWLQMPELLSIAGQPAPSKSQVRALSSNVNEASVAADKAGYRLQTMLGIDAKKHETSANPIEKDTVAGREATTKAGESAGNDSLVHPLKRSEEVPAKPNR